MIKKVTNSLFPKNSWRRKIVKKILVKLHLKSPFIAGYYNTWSQQQRSFITMGQMLQDVSKGPLVSIVVPAYNTPINYFSELVYSIISQTYNNWELIIVNASDDPKLKKHIDGCAKKDLRIKVMAVKNAGISINTNKGINASSGEYIAFCDHDDIIEPFALYEVVLRIINEQAELIYTDEDKISDDGEIYFDPHFKPDWSPDLFTHVNYINHLTVVKKSLIKKAGLLNPDRDGAQDYDLLLRIIDLKPKIAHVAKVLYHWRATHNSTAQDFSTKKNITIAGVRSLEDHFDRVGHKVAVIPKENKPGFYELVFEKITKISIVIMPFISDASLRLFIEILIHRTRFDGAEFQLLIPEGSSPRFEMENIKVEVIKNDNNFLEKAIKSARFDDVIIIGRVALPDDNDWATRLCSVLRQTHINAVSPLIVQNNDYVDDCGLVIDSFGNLQALFKGHSLKSDNNDGNNCETFFGNTNWVRNVDALTGGVVAVRKAQFELFLGSFDGDIHKAVLEYSSVNKKHHKYNTLYSEVVMDSYAIQLPPKDPYPSVFFNNCLTMSYDRYLLFTPESAVANILSIIADQEGLSL